MRLAVVVAAVLGSSLVARAQPAELEYNLWIDVPVVAGATGLWLGSEALKGTLAPETCRWCDEDLNALDASVRDALRWSDPEAGDLASNIAIVAAIPASAGMLVLAEGIDGAFNALPIDMLLVAEATTSAAAINQGVKLAVGRERPFVHALAPDEKLRTKHPDDNNLSFYSGHANLAFALATSSGTIASMRGYSWAPWVWAVGLPVAAATSYFRIAGDRHYFTDVLVGAAAGSAIGVGVPLLFHRPVKNMPRLGAAPLKRGTLVTMTWAL